ncbi:iron-containing redox enzyme family protein [Acinetobacter nosocomialis]|uniref:iron-containing redox enzyme family protein n=1 Tax=Acinetobacter nosocomialis TaxID=106654 RepID=UPI000667D6C0|nr:iron-containing redox enzyme family protein [Acinetobacter nosocomialis]
MSKKFEDFNNPRQKALQGMRNSIPAEQWEENLLFLQQLRNKIAALPVCKHPAIELLNNGKIDKASLTKIHLEYRHAIVQIFTDALLMAQFQTKQLEPSLPSGSKMFPRVLLSLNILDEFGFRPGLDSEGYYLGNPEYAHYPLYEDLLNDYGLSEQDRRNFQPSQIADKVRTFLESSYDSYINVVALLAVAEEEVILFSPPLREATKAVGIDIEGGGYYHVHGVSTDETYEAADDDHEDDLWFALAQAITKDNYESLTTLCIEYCDLWNKFWDKQVADLSYIEEKKLA